MLQTWPLFTPETSLKRQAAGFKIKCDTVNLIVGFRLPYQIGKNIIWKIKSTNDYCTLLRKQMKIFGILKNLSKVLNEIHSLPM